MAGSDIGIDLGTASVLVYVRGKGVVLKEPSVVAYDKDTNEIKAIGEEARQMMGGHREILRQSDRCTRELSLIIQLQKRCCVILYRRLWEERH